MLLSFSVVVVAVVERHSSPIHTEEEDAVTHRKPYKVPNINLLTNTRHSFRTSSSLSLPSCLPRRALIQILCGDEKLKLPGTVRRRSGRAEQVKKASTIKMHTRFVGFVVRSMAHPPPAHPRPPLLVWHGLVSSRSRHRLTER